MGYEEDLQRWKLEIERHKNWLKAANSSASTKHQVPSIKMQLEAVKKRKPIKKK